MSLQTGVLLVNLGTPDSPEVSDVRKYLREFLMDERVIDINPIGRWLLVNLIIAPFRSPKSAKIYKELWTEKGSPLLYNTLEVTNLVQKNLGDNYKVVAAMRYQSPSIEKGLEILKKENVKSIVIIPLFPQYASASTGSVQQKVMEIVSKWQTIPELHFIDSFPTDENVIATFAENGKKYLSQKKYDHILFTYHGLPERQIRKGDCTGKCLSQTCCDKLEDWNRLCYRAQCFATSRALADELGISKDDYTVSFQSRLGSDPWIKPYSDEILKVLVKSGKKKILAFSPAFVSDCLETTIEIGEEYRELVLEEGGEELQLVESLNTHPMWVEALTKMVRRFDN